MQNAVQQTEKTVPHSSLPVSKLILQKTPREDENNISVTRQDTVGQSSVLVTLKSNSPQDVITTVREEDNEYLQFGSL